MELINIQVNSSPYYRLLLPKSSLPVYSVFPSSLLSFTMEKILASEPLSAYSIVVNSYFIIKLANAHRVFVTKELTTASAVLSPSSHSNLTGIVSIVDSAFLFFTFPKKKYGRPFLILYILANSTFPLCSNSKNSEYRSDSDATTSPCILGFFLHL